MKKMICIIIVIFLLLGVFFLPQTETLKEYNKNLFYMDTYIDIKLYATNEKTAEKAFVEIEKIYKKYHELTNIYDENSEIYKINNSKEEIITISDELYNILKLSLEYKDISKNKFNINMANITKLWKKYRDDKNGVPSLDELESNYINNEIILLDNKQLKNNDLSLDLGAVSKGYATYIASEHLKKIGIKNYIINAGGNVVVGEAYKKEYFSIGIESPIENDGIYKIVKGNNISVVTSGGYERFYEYEGIKYHHVIDPDTLYPANNMLSVTVITNNSAIADIMSTILFLLPAEEGLEIVNNMDNIEAIFYIDKDNIKVSEGISKYE